MYVCVYHAIVITVLLPVPRYSCAHAVRIFVQNQNAVNCKLPGAMCVCVRINGVCVRMRLVCVRCRGVNVSFGDHFGRVCMSVMRTYIGKPA